MGVGFGQVAMKHKFPVGFTFQKYRNMGGPRPAIHLSVEGGKGIFSNKVQNFRLTFPGVKWMDVHVSKVLRGDSHKLQ